MSEDLDVAKAPLPHIYRKEHQEKILTERQMPHSQYFTSTSTDASHTVTEYELFLMDGCGVARIPIDSVHPNNPEQPQDKHNNNHNRCITSTSH